MAGKEVERVNDFGESMPLHEKKAAQFSCTEKIAAMKNDNRVQKLLVCTLLLEKYGVVLHHK